MVCRLDECDDLGRILHPGTVDTIDTRLLSVFPSFPLFFLLWGLMDHIKGECTVQLGVDFGFTQ